MIESIIPETVEAWLALRAKDITSTEAAALFGASPYMTPFELWHRKHKAEVVSIEENERMTWGTRLQDSIAAGLAQDNGWVIRKMTEYVRDTEARLGASFDFRILKGEKAGETDIRFDSPEDELLEIKNVDSLIYKQGWLVDGKNIEAPPHIEIQVQHQLLVSGLKKATIGALIGGNRVVEIVRVADELIQRAIRQKAAEFWKSIESGIAPDPNFALDAEFIGRLYNYAEPGKVLDANGNEKIGELVKAYQQAAAAEKDAVGLKKAAKAELLTLIGGAEKVISDDFSVSAGLIGPTRIEAYDRAGYRDFRVFAKKQKAVAA